MIFWVLFPVFVGIWMDRWEVLVLVYLLMRASGDDWMEPSTMSKHGFCNSCRTGFWLGEVLGERMAVFFVFLVTYVEIFADVQSMLVLFSANCAWAVHGDYLRWVKVALQRTAQMDFGLFTKMIGKFSAHGRGTRRAGGILAPLPQARPQRRVARVVWRRRDHGQQRGPAHVERDRWLHTGAGGVLGWRRTDRAPRAGSLLGPSPALRRHMDCPLRPYLLHVEFYTIFMVMTLQKAGGFEYQDIAYGAGGFQSFLSLCLCS